MININRITYVSRFAARCRINKLASTRPLDFRNCFTPVLSNSRYLTSQNNVKHDQKFKWPFHMTMTSEQKEAKEKKIEQMKQEEPPKSLFSKVKYYFKRYWYIAIPAHTVSCTAWFIGLYFLVKSGVDVIALLKTLHIPEYIVQKVQNTPPSAGVVVVALLLYKLVIPLRYATTLLLIQASFWTLRRMGKLRTVREVEYKVRSVYRNLGVRDAARKQSASQQVQDKASPSPSEKKT